MTVPAEKGDVRNLTAERRRPRARRRSGRPDGTRIAYFSDKAGEYQLDRRGRRTARASQRPSRSRVTDSTTSPIWSPDSQRIAYTDNSQSLYWIDLKTGRSKKIASQETYTPSPQLRSAWSPDSKWLAYTIGTRPLVMAVSVYSIDQDKSFAVTDGLAEVTEPVFDRSGKYLYFFGSTDAGPVLDWFSQSGSDMRETRNVYLTVLRKDLPSPLAKESDEEGTKNPKDANDTKDAEGRQGRRQDQPGSPAARARRRRDGRDGAHRRRRSGSTWTTSSSASSTCRFRRATCRTCRPATPGRSISSARSTTSRRCSASTSRSASPRPCLRDVCDYHLSADGKKMLYRSHDSWFIVPTTKEVKAGEGKIATDAIEVKVDPRAEWTEIFDEAWRINRDYFYDPDMHGADWTAVRAKYAAFLPDVTTRSDLNRVMQWMASELSVGHTA